MTLMRDVGNINGNVGNKAKSGNRLKYKTYLLSEDQVDDSQPFPARVGRDISTIPLLAGEYWHYLKTVAMVNPELLFGGNDSDIGATLTNTLKVVVGDLADNVLDLVENGVGRGFYVVVEACDTGNKKIVGNGCKPAILKVPEGGFAADKTGLNLTFENQCGELVSNYVGTIQLQTPESVTAAAISFALVTGNDDYLFEADTLGAIKANVTGITDADVNRVITVHGGGGTSPSQIDNSGNFVLISGATWTADAGTQISFKIFKDGAATYKLFEVSGSRS